MTPLTRCVDILALTQIIMNVTQHNTKQQETNYSRKKKQQEFNDTRQKVLSGRIPYMVTDSGATSSYGRTSNPFIGMGQLSTK